MVIISYAMGCSIKKNLSPPSLPGTGGERSKLYLPQDSWPCGLERYLDLRKIRRGFRKKPGTLGAPVLQRRKPMLLLRFAGVLLFRLAQRRLFAVLPQFPPRFTRLLPFYDTFPNFKHWLNVWGIYPPNPLIPPFVCAPFGAHEWLFQKCKRVKTLKFTRIYQSAVLQRRKPKLMLRTAGELWLNRLAQRRTNAVLPQYPPRSTR